MSQSDPISVRITRLNNLLLGKGNVAISGVTTKPSRRSIAVTNASVSPAVAEALNREGLMDAFCLLYNECDKEILKKRDRNIAEFINKFRNVIDEAKLLRVNTNDFNVKKLIGKGYFGNVNLVVERQTGDIYAMKKIKKSVVTTSQVKEERDIMSRRSSEWITNLQYAFQDNENLYLVMEFLPGGDLLSLMSRHGPFDEDLARFYIAELTLAIHSLHSIGFVHRDIKPENILIDRFGHIKLADFGNAAALDRDGQVLSLSPVGTPDYIAPELLQTISTYKPAKSLHDVSCDYWSMGIIGYELICEITPFHEDNVHETYSKILSHCEENHLKEIITFPSDLRLSANFKNLIESLVTNPKNRISYEKIRQHPYFETIKWEMLRSEVPPIIPNVNSEDDTSNFDDVARTKARTSTFVKKSINANMKSNDFSGKDLPFIGYSFVHMEKQVIADETASDESRLNKLNSKIKELQIKLKERTEEIAKLRQEIMRAEQMSKQSDSQSKILQDAKEEINKMKNIIKEKTIELAACKTQIKTLKSSVKIEEEMWEKKESTITDLLRMNRQKYEDAKIASEQRYEKMIAEKKNELASIVKKLDARESELNTKNEECAHLQTKISNYKEMLRQFKEQAQNDKSEFERNRLQITETYEEKLLELRTKLRNEKETKSRLTMELKDIRSELNDSINSGKSEREAKNASNRNHEELLKRLNKEIDANNKLHSSNMQLDQQLSEMKKAAQDYQQEISRLERELKVAECGRNLAESTLAAESSPYETAPGSLSELHDIEDQLRTDLEIAKENENEQRQRAEKLQEIVKNFEQMMEHFNEPTLSPTKIKATSGNISSSAVGDMLEKQNEKLEDKLEAVREQMILERQSARTANLSLWKTEKKLEEALSDNKMIKRRMELTEDRIKRVQTDREEAQRLCKAAEEEVKIREERIQELKHEILTLKDDIMKEHKMWEKSEQERMKCKADIIDHIANAKKLEERVADYRHKLQQTQQKCDQLGIENKSLVHEIAEEHDRSVRFSDNASELHLQLTNLQSNYDALKYACMVTDSQMTDVEAMLDAEQRRNKSQQENIESLYMNIHEKDDFITLLQQQLADEQSKVRSASNLVKSMNFELDENRLNLQEMQKKLIIQQQQLVEQTNNLYEAQERLEVLTNDVTHLQNLNGNLERELHVLKEENTRILSELFHSKDEITRTLCELKDSQLNNEELHEDFVALQSTLAEKENFYLQRDIKSEATLSQHKKLIDYLQLKVEDLSQKKKKTLADKLFGTSATPSRKENISPSLIESSILYRALQEELKREKLQTKNLQEQIDKINGEAKKNTSTTATLRSPLKNKYVNTGGDDDNKNQSVKSIQQLMKSPSKLKSSPSTAASSEITPRPIITTTTHELSHHRFELNLQEINSGVSECAGCAKPILIGSPFWKCKTCKDAVHRKCRGIVDRICDGMQLIRENIAARLSVDDKGIQPTAPELSDNAVSDHETASLGKYSYNAQIDTVDANAKLINKYVGTLILDAEKHNSIDVNCAFEIEEDKILLLGCNNGLFAYHIHTQRLLHIAGIDSVSDIAVSLPLAKAILVGTNAESLYQCDYRQLVSRSQTSTLLKTALEASVLDLTFANRSASEKWQLVRISNEAENALDSVAIAATSTRIVILKYDMKLQKFKPVRALDLATPVSSILYTRHTAIVSSDKFYEIDLNTYGAEEFVDLSDPLLTHTNNLQPVVAIRVSRQEFLLCFMECGVFVDEYGRRSRPYDLNWEYTPTGFIYREPFLFISHFQSIQVMRIHRSYSNELGKKLCKDIDGDTDDALVDGRQCNLKRVHVSLYMPTLVADSGEIKIYAIAADKETGLQQIHHIDALKLMKSHLSASLETISSIATSVTIESTTNAESIV